MTAPLLQTTAVAKAFGPVVALRAVDLTVRPGESHALLGANGAGKSTMVKILTGVLRADAGMIALHGPPTGCDGRATPRPPGWRRSSRIRRWPPTSPSPRTCACPAPTSAPCGPSWRRWASTGSTSTSRCATSHCRSCGCSTSPGHWRSTRSCSLLDEITAALPPDLSERVFAVMRRWKERNRSVLFISHRLAEVRAHCDMCTVLRDGRDVASFVPGEGGEAQIVAAMLGEAATGVRDEVRARARRPSRSASRSGPRSRARRRRPPARGRLARRRARRGARARRARGPGPGDPLRHPRREPQAPTAAAC